jgi:ketosteroid isomerase-like protein
MTSDELEAKQSIAEGLYRYCRSLDRMDEELYAMVFEAGAQLDYGDYFRGTAEAFRDWVWAAHNSMQAHSHQITNILTEINERGDGAVSEAYVTVCLRTKPDENGNTVDIVDRGRYVDSWTRRDDGSWRIAGRRFRSDIQQVSDASTAPPVTGVRDRTDLSYDLLGRPAG